MAKTEAKTLWAMLGQQLREARETNEWRQEDLASVARQHGLNWRRATVAAVEAGEREVGLEEIILLSVALQKPLAWWIEGYGLSEEERMEMVRLTPDAAAPRIGLVSLLKGEDPARSFR
ncbi:MAG: helix-turn-helix transcriptional regulator, partial [Actinomycetota bacterium]|nr:helix-turn-helix transcriptional regulator [Actinomycetota bacterium]